MSGKFQHFNAIDGSIEMLKYRWISKNFNSNEKFEKHFTSPKEPSAWQKLFSPPPDKSFLRLWNKNVRTKIYRNIQTFTFQELRECCSWASRNGAVQFFFWHQPETCFWLCCGGIFFILLSDSRFLKWVTFFERNCIVKWVIVLVFIGFEFF